LTSTRGRADPIGGPAGAELLFDAHTLVLGNLHEGSEEVEPESISEGTLADGIPWIFNETPVRLMPHSAALFEEGAVFGTLGADAVVAWDEGKTPLAAGTRFFIAGLGMIPDWALPSKDTTVTVKKLTIPIPAGSTIRSQWERIAGIVFSKPVQIRVGAAALSLFSAGFANTGPNHLTDAALSAPATVSFGGKTVALTDRVTFDELGNLKSGRLQADTAFTMGGRTITLRGGYDPEEPDAGMVGVYPSGRVRSGVLAAAADFPLGKTRVRLVRGDAVRFREDGSVEACTPAAGVTVTAGGRQVRFAGGELVVNPDGTVASGALAADTTLEVGGTAATFLGGSGIFFYPSGAISGGKVRATTMKLGLFEGRVEGDARFFENGVPYWAVPLGAVSVGGFAYFFRYVQLDSSRRVIEGEVVKPTDVPVGGRHYVFSSIMRFYESGSVRAGGLSTSLMEPFSFTINGSPLETSLEYVCFYPDGAMMWARTPTNNASTFNNATIPDWSSVYVYRSKEGNERVFFFPRTEQYRDLVTQDVPFTLVGEEILIPAGSTVDNAFFTDTPDDAAALLTKDVTFRGRVLGHAGAFVSRTEMAKGIMEMKAGAASGTALFATSTQSRVRVRRAANLQGETVGSLEKGDRVQVLDKSADMMKVGDMTDYWYRVRRVSDGLSGWTYGYYLAAEQ
jgi:hypothetical protein